MKRYETYKDSGILWLDAIPSHWHEEKLKHISTCNDEVLSEDTPDEQIIHYVEISDVDSVSGINNHTDYTFANAPSRARRITRKNDVIISTVRTYLKAIATVKEDGLIVSTGFAVIRPTKVNQKYLAYSLLNDDFLGEVISKSVGVSYPAISSTDLIEIKLPVPPKEEQEAIAAFLDHKVGQIDTTIAEKEQMLDELKAYRSAIISEAVTKGLDKNVEMKDSGSEWIGMIPKHWVTKRLKFVSDNFDGTHYSPETKENGKPYVTAADIRGKGIDYASTKKISQKDYDRLVEQGCKIENNDVLLVKDGATTGRVGLMIDCEECVALSSVAMLRPKEGIYPLFLMYCMMSNAMQNQITNSMAGSAMPRITLTKLNEFVVCVPHFDEQRKIAAFIDGKVEKIGQTIDEINIQIDALKSYKSALITEAVTGKIDLREWKTQRRKRLK